MNDAFRNTLVVEVKDLLAEVVVLDEERTAGTLFEGILIVGDGMTLLIGQDREAFIGTLVELAALPSRSAENRELLRFSIILALLGWRLAFHASLLGSRRGFRGRGCTLGHVALLPLSASTRSSRNRFGSSRAQRVQVPTAVQHDALNNKVRASVD
jgi:hypothetical protein